LRGVEGGSSLASRGGEREKGKGKAVSRRGPSLRVLAEDIRARAQKRKTWQRKGRGLKITKGKTGIVKKFCFATHIKKKDHDIELSGRKINVQLVERKIG